MKLKRQPESAPSELGVVPLVNIVFLLLIFFMLAGRITPSETLDVDPPDSRSGVADNVQPLLILLDSTGRVAVGDTVVTSAGFAAEIRRHLERNPGVSFRLKADAALPAEVLVTVMEQLRQEGVTRLSLLTEHDS